MSLPPLPPSLGCGWRIWTNEACRHLCSWSLGRGEEGRWRAIENFADWLQSCAERGHELCLHGWDHTATAEASLGRTLVGNLVARGCGEYWSLNEDEAADRARRGLHVMAGLGLHVTGFTPPGWLASAAAIRGLQRAGLHYVTSHRSVTDLRTGRRLRALVICHRPNGFGERAGVALMARTPGLLRPGRTLRIALHPDDLTRSGLQRVGPEGHRRRAVCWRDRRHVRDRDEHFRLRGASRKPVRALQHRSGPPRG